MNTNIVTLEEMAVVEEDAFRRAGLDLLGHSRRMLKDLRIARVPEGRGIARLVNLLQWDVGEHMEYLDGEVVAADQVVHFAMHHIWDQKLGSDHPLKMLFAECMASASDIYLVGKLSHAGEETDFLADTLESFGSYFEMYSSEEELEELVIQVVEEPFETMIEAARYLFELGSCLLEQVIDMDKLILFQDHLFYPLAHHYNISNWVLTIRNRFPNNPDIMEGTTTLENLPSDEATWLKLFKI